MFLKFNVLFELIKISKSEISWFFDDAPPFEK